MRWLPTSSGKSIVLGSLSLLLVLSASTVWGEVGAKPWRGGPLRVEMIAEANTLDMH